MAQYQEYNLPPVTKGLVLADQPNVIDPSAALDVMDVSFSQRGAVGTRYGYGKFTTSEGTNRFDSMAAYYTTAGTNQLVCGAGNRLDVLNTSGGVVASSTSPTASPHYFTRFGGPNNEVMYIANGTDTVRQWNGSAFSTPAWVTTTIDGNYLAVTPWDNRLVCAKLNGTTAGDNPNTVRFSNPGDPLTFGANNYVDLTPGDGEVITGMVAWGERLIVFKQSKFFVFSTTNTDSAGAPVFGYNPVVGRGLFTPGAVAVGTDGVYFLDHDGVYKTTGGTAQYLSELIEPFFLGGTLDNYTGGQMNPTSLSACRMAFADNSMFLACPTGTSTTNNRILVYDIVGQTWTVYSIPAKALTSWRISALDELMFAYPTGTKDVGRHSASYTTDAGTAIPALYKGGWFDAGSADMKVVRQTKMWGKGHVSFGLGYDFQPASQTDLVNFNSGASTWGSSTWGGTVWGSNAPVAYLNRNAVKGTVLSVQLQSYDSTPWSFNRATTLIRESRQESVIA